jgi:predicted nuclease of predicted toxin-antitoxin system
VRFVLDNDVPVSVRAMLRRHGHEAWSAHDAGLSDAADDDLTVYAVKQRSVLISLDSQFMHRRRINAIGNHVRLR